MKIGVLALQGGVIEHLKALQRIGVDGVIVRNMEEIQECQGLIIPGGESTTLGKLLRELGLFNPLTNLIHSGFPVWGTCAGMILLAKNVANQGTSHIGELDVTVQRNGFGTQKNSFLYEGTWSPNGKKIPMVFIRAPYIQEVGPDVKILSTVQDKIVAVQQNNMLATAFHPELTEDSEVLQYFVSMCKKEGN